MRGRPGPVMVFIGPGLLVLKQDGSKFLRRTVPGTRVEIWREKNIV
jgi:hypothetical protein